MFVLIKLSTVILEYFVVSKKYCVASCCFTTTSCEILINPKSSQQVLFIIIIIRTFETLKSNEQQNKTDALVLNRTTSLQDQIIF